MNHFSSGVGLFCLSVCHTRGRERKHKDCTAEGVQVLSDEGSKLWRQAKCFLEGMIDLSTTLMLHSYKYCSTIKTTEYH